MIISMPHLSLATVTVQEHTCIKCTPVASTLKAELSKSQNKTPPMYDSDASQHFSSDEPKTAASIIADKSKLKKTESMNGIIPK